MASSHHQYLKIDQHKIPVKIYREWRLSVRASIGKKNVLLRVPQICSTKEFENYVKWCEEWVKKQLETNPKVRSKLLKRQYKTGDFLEVGKRKYLISIKKEDRKTHSAKISNGTIHIKLADHVEDIDAQDAIRSLLSRVIGQDFHDEISKRVDDLNDRFFKKDIKNIRLKYNQSNWGSCSANNNLNLSTRLLFAPQHVIDYVIVHELAHLIELNHSPKFWKLVEAAMPDYKSDEKWLKEYGHLCDF